jgi:hypothetical protein
VQNRMSLPADGSFGKPTGRLLSTEQAQIFAENRASGSVSRISAPSG